MRSIVRGGEARQGQVPDQTVRERQARHARDIEGDGVECRVVVLCGENRCGKILWGGFMWCGAVWRSTAGCGAVMSGAYKHAY